MQRNRLVALDSLRGIAAMLVVLYHFTTSYGAEFGWPLNQPPLIQIKAQQVGVAIFFVISGFVISMTLERSRTPMDFAVSRFARLFPLFWVCALATTALICLTQFNPFHLTPAGFFSSMTMLNGMTKLPFVDPSYWTLTRELLFYVLLCAIYFVYGPEKVTVSVLVWITVSTVYNLTVADSSYYACGSVASCVSLSFNTLYGYLFASGIMLHKLYSGDRRPLVYMTLVIAILSGSVSEWPTHHAMIWTTSAKAAVYSALVWAAVSGHLRLIQTSVLVFLGTISFSVYLIHQVFGIYILHALLVAGVDVNLAIIVTLMVIIVLGAVICYGVERPMQRMIRRAYEQRRITQLIVA